MFIYGQVTWLAALHEVAVAATFAFRICMQL
jgi:hypothetical protein